MAGVVRVRGRCRDTGPLRRPLERAIGAAGVHWPLSGRANTGEPSRAHDARVQVEPVRAVLERRELARAEPGRPVYSGFGATDLEIGIAGETPVSVAIRRAARTDEDVRRVVFGADSRLPMLFQYNPLSHQIVVNDESELVFTIARPHVLSPRILYNIRDEGGVATFSEMKERLRIAGTSVERILGVVDRKPIRLPFVWVYGRKDSTVSVMGANIYPEDVEQALYDEPDLAARTHSFCLSLSEDEHGAMRPCFSFEIRGDVSDDLRGEFEQRIPERIRLLNADFRTAVEEHADSVRPLVELYGSGEGPFAADAAKIKQTRIIKIAGR